MSTYAVVILVLVAFALGAVAHEADMRRTIKKEGHTHYSGWLGKIEGKVIY